MSMTRPMVENNGISPLLVSMISLFNEGNEEQLNLKANAMNVVFVQGNKVPTQTAGFLPDVSR